MTMNSSTSFIIGTLAILVCVIYTPNVQAFVPNHGVQKSAPSFVNRPNVEKQNDVSLSMVATTAPSRTQASGRKKRRASHNGINKELAAIYRNADVIFSVIDIDGNGFLSRQELAEHLATAGYQPKVVDQIFSKMDVNKDGQVCREEFLSGMKAIPALQNAPGFGTFNMQHYKKEILQDADQVFQSADADGNGFLDNFEFKSHLGRMFGRGYTDKAVQKMFQLLDVNGDKKISKKEFRGAFLRCSALRQVIGEGPNYK